MGIFDSYSTPVSEIPTGFGLGVSSVPYAVVVTDIKEHTKEDGTQSTIITLTVDTQADAQHRKGKEDIWITHPVDGNEKAEGHAKNAKTWVSTHLGVPDSVSGQPGFSLVAVKDKLVGQVYGYLHISTNGEFTNKRFTRVKQQGTTGPSNVQVPAAKEEAPIDMAKLLEQTESSGTW